jgi:hypothetical protein
VHGGYERNAIVKSSETKYIKRDFWREQIKSDLLLLRFRVPQNLVDNIHTLIDTI